MGQGQGDGGDATMQQGTTIDEARHEEIQRRRQRISEEASRIRELTGLVGVNPREARRLVGQDAAVADFVSAARAHRLHPLRRVHEPRPMPVLRGGKPLRRPEDGVRR